MFKIMKDDNYYPLNIQWNQKIKKAFSKDWAIEYLLIIFVDVLYVVCIFCHTKDHALDTNIIKHISKPRMFVEVTLNDKNSINEIDL